MATPESKAKAKIRALVQAVCLEQHIGVFIRNNTAGGVGFANGTPDLTLFLRSQYSPLTNSAVDIEVKAGYNTPSPLQLCRLNESHAAGNHALVIWGDDARDLEWLREFLVNLHTYTEPCKKLVRHF